MLRAAVTTFAAGALALVGLTAPMPSVAEEITLKLWSRADRSGPLRAGNIVAAADQFNRMLAASGSDVTVRIDVHENNADGFDAEALDLMKAFAVDKGADI